MFFTCPYSKEVWYGLAKKLLSSRFTTVWETVLQLLTDKFIRKDRQLLLQYIFRLTIYFIWKEQNSRRHGEAPLPPGQLIRMLDKQIRNRLSSIREEAIDDMMGVWRFGSHQDKERRLSIIVIWIYVSFKSSKQTLHLL